MRDGLGMLLRRSASAVTHGAERKRIVRALAEAFYEQSHYERGIEAYRLLIKLEPTSPDCNEYALKIAQGFAGQANK